MTKKKLTLITLITLMQHIVFAGTLSLEQAYTWLANKNDQNIALSFLLPHITSEGSYTKTKTQYYNTVESGEVKAFYDQKFGGVSLTQELFNIPSYFTYSQASEKATQDLLIYQITTY